MFTARTFALMIEEDQKLISTAILFSFYSSLYIDVLIEQES